jgi:2-polyprenyl-3-methyl-5-hydroxy-6-metoxy-1,4-benzoquinol methylase
MDYFVSTKKMFKEVVQEIITTDKSYEVDEAALPAYADKNPLIDYIFWKRIKLAYNHSLKEKKGNVLDFGCGIGLFSYLLSKTSENIVAIDIETKPLELVKSKVDFSNNIKFKKGELKNTDIPDNSLDTIYALDVLEHIENIDEYIDLFLKKLKLNGKVVVSGPTENTMYKIGRRLAGERFTGDYHVTNISGIKKAFTKKMKVKTLGKIMWPFTLFEIFEATKE